MKTKTIKRKMILLSAMLFIAMFALSACSDSNNSDGNNNQTPANAMAEYQIQITNLTNNQPFSPPVFVLHKTGFSAWETGTPASAEMEQLAESGNPAPLGGMAANAGSVKAVAEGSGIIAPGMKTMATLMAGPDADLSVTVATMLVNTNDAFTGIAAYGIGSLGVGESMTIPSVTYDAGTEANTESSATIPGPAAGGEGYNTENNDTGIVFVHPGVVTADDGLSTSVLDESHRFDNPTALIAITRIN